MSRNGPLALAFHGLFVTFMLAPIVVVCLVAFTPEGFLSLPTNGFSLRWFRAIADYPEFVQELPAGRRERVVDVLPEAGSVITRSRVVVPVAALEVSAPQQRPHQLHAEAAREVVVAGTRLPQGCSAGSLPQRADGAPRREALQRLEQLPHLRAGQPHGIPRLGFHDGSIGRLGQLPVTRTPGSFALISQRFEVDHHPPPSPHLPDSPVRPASFR